MNSKVVSNKPEDLSGKNRLIWNTLISWASHLVLVVSGFIMPRLMDEYIGQFQLGIWDFCWAFISYLSVIGLGIGSSSNRYVAKYRADNELKSLKMLVSSSIFIETFICIAICIATFAIVYSLPLFFAEKLTTHVGKTQSVILFLGLSLTLTTLFSTSRGLLTGHHRWDLHNALTAGFSVLSLILMMIMLFSGFGIVGMALGYLVTTIIFEAIRFFIAVKLCRKLGISVGISNISKKVCYELLGFSVKNKVAVLPPVFLLQTVNILVVNAFGPAVLAVFARPLALTRHISTFMVKFTMILTPTAGTMLSEDKAEELKSFFLTTTKFSFAFTLPLVITLAIFGDIVIEFWMGADYVNYLLIIILSLGALLPTAQDCALRIMIAKNDHGGVSVYMTLVVVVSFLVLYSILSRDDFSLITAALLLVIPSNLAYGLTLPIYACKKLSVKLLDYLSIAVLKPVLSVLPFTLMLMTTKHYFLEQAYIYAGLIFVLAIASIIILYGLLLLNPSQKSLLLKKLR